MRTFNIKETNIDNNDPCLGILAVEAFIICSTYNGIKGYSLGQLVFVRDMPKHGSLLSILVSLILNVRTRLPITA